MLPSILLFFPLAPLIVFGQTFESVCKGIGDLGNCKATVNIPTGELSMKMCEKDFFNVSRCLCLLRVLPHASRNKQINPCKTKSTVWVPCPTIPKPFRQCPKDFCVPGEPDKDIRTGDNADLFPFLTRHREVNYQGCVWCQCQKQGEPDPPPTMCSS